MTVDRLDELGIRPLNARSVVLSALLGTHPPELPVAALVGLATAFDIPPGTVRTALSRMTAAGEVTSEEGRYRLAGRMIERQREQDRGRIAPAAVWDGRWWTVTTSGDGRTAAERRRFRAAMLGARLGELRPGVWMRPANIDLDVASFPSGPGSPGATGASPSGAGGATDARIDLVVVRGELRAGDPVPLALRLWDLAASERQAELLRAALDRSTATLATDDGAIASAFSVFAACLRFLRSEPQLPVELAPTPAAGALRADYDRAEPLLQSRLRALNRHALATADSA